LMKVPIFIEGLRTSIVAGCGQLIMTRPVARAQAVRDVIEAHTGATPPPLPPQPPAAPYGRVALDQSVPLLGALPVLAPGDGAPARTPERMEAFGQRRAPRGPARTGRGAGLPQGLGP